MELLYGVKRKINKFLAEQATKQENTLHDAETNVKLHYILKKKNSRNLAIIFSSANADGPRYSYMSTMRSVNINQLFIKDDFEPKTGDYYLGKDMRFDEEKAVLSLINLVLEMLKPEKVFFIGSSKGGYAAINFGIHYPRAVIIAGAPQYNVGTYMSEVKKFRPALSLVLGKPFEQITEQDIKFMNGRLKGKLMNSAYCGTQKLYLHCSTNESTYEGHVVYLMKDAETAGLRYEFDAADYHEHGDLRFHFPNYIKKCIKEETKHA